MAFRTQKISQMTPKGSDLEATDLIEVSTIESGSYVTRSITGQELIDAIPAPTGFVPTTRTLTINGTTQDLSADRTFTISTGITIGTTAITSGTVGRVLFEGTGNVVQESANLFWDNTNVRLGIGGTPTNTLNVVGSTTTFDVVTWKSSTGNTGYLGSDAGQIAITTASGGGGSFLSMNTNNFTMSCGALWRALVGGTERMRIPTTGNVLINTTTDAGFRLDVNGTARVNTLTIGLGGGQVATNTTLGFQAGNATATAGGSTYIGYQAGNKNIGGSITAIGHTSAFNNTNGDGITAIGGRALLSNTTGNYNTAVGYSSLLSNTTGSSNTAIGVDASSGNFTGSVILGRNATATANNQFVVGSSTINAGTVTTEINASTQVWNVVINGVAYKILLA